MERGSGRGNNVRVNKQKEYPATNMGVLVWDVVYRN